MAQENSALRQQTSHKQGEAVVGMEGQKAYTVKRADDTTEFFQVERVQRAIAWASQEHTEVVDQALILKEAYNNLFDGMSPDEIGDALILSASTFIERDPAYGYVAARLLFKKLYRAVVGRSVLSSDIDRHYCLSFIENIKKGVSVGKFHEKLLTFDLEELSLNVIPARDQLIDYMGLRTLYERYFARHQKAHIELPQTFLMRVAMGLAMNEDDKNARAIEFYQMMSSLRYLPSTPTLLHAGFAKAQLSSCFINTVKDDLHNIFKCFGDNAQLSKWSGGVANDWTNVRATGSHIESINTESQGTIPFLKINSDVTASINRSGKRRAATVCYLETWHYDIEDFLDLRRNTGDERRRAHDINTANWIPDLFMKRVEEDGDWTLFSPHEVPELHALYGAAFEKKYLEYEEIARGGTIELTRVVSATKLWRKMLSRLFETGHPWVTFKDPSNIRSPQDHAGVVHSSNLCTEITLNTSEDETAVCNLGSINLGRHVVNGKLDEEMLTHTVTIAIRMLDNVIDITYYPIPEAKNANMRHRAIGMGLMGFQDALYDLNINFSDEAALTFADEVMEKISYHAILASSQLAAERGTYQSYKGSKWDRGIFPVDTLALLEKERGEKITVNRDEHLDWTPVREHLQKHGMRNSNVMAIAPTATIANIAGCFPCIEPIYKNLYVKANMSGEFTVVNKFLHKDLRERGLWDKDMLDQLKYYDGSVQMIDRIPDDLKARHKESFEVDPEWLIDVTAARMKWIDQSQSHNVFLKGVSGKKLHDVYFRAWKAGVKTMYYLRTLGASQIEKSTLDASKFGYTQKREYSTTGTAGANGAAVQEAKAKPAKASKVEQQACSIENGPDCDMCQ